MRMSYLSKFIYLHFINSIYRKILNILKRIYVNETLILFEHKDYKKIDAPIAIEYASHTNVYDILYFQSQTYVYKFKEFLDLGDIGYFAYLNGKCVHRSWVKFNEQLVSLHWSLKYQLKPNEYFIHYSETAPEAKGKGIYQAVLSKIVQDFRNKGKILISTNAKNIPSIKGIKKAGFKELERTKVFMILGIKIIRKQIF